MKSKEKMSISTIRLAALAAAGTYLLYGKRGAKNREKIADWAVQLKKEVIERAEKIKEFNQVVYVQIIDEIIERYVRVKKVTASELWHIAEELKSAWVHIADQFK